MSKPGKTTNQGPNRILGIARYPAIPPSIADEERPRSIGLAEVKWRQELAGKSATGYGIGLRYLTPPHPVPLPIGAEGTQPTSKVDPAGRA